MLDRSLRDRYSRQTVFPGIGEVGQAKLLNSSAVIIGCGALGCSIATLLVRAGVGKIKIVDRDFVEYHNLQRQVLFDEDDVRTELPKAIAAERHLKKVNSTVEIQGIVADVNYTNIEGFCRGANVILDGLDNLETRLLINDVALKHSIPWVYGGAIASNGMTMTILPCVTPCFRCISPVLPPAEARLSCETAGVVGTVPAIIGALGATEAMKIITGSGTINRDLTIIDVWKGTWDYVKISRVQSCPACGGRYEFLDKRFAVKTTVLCGQRRAVQIVNAQVTAIDLDKAAARLRGVSNVKRAEYMLSFHVDDYDIVVFPDGRAIIKNTIDELLAKQLYDRYVANLA